MSDPKDVSVSAETSDSWYIGIAGMRLWKVATVWSGDDRRLVVGFCSGVYLTVFAIEWASEFGAERAVASVERAAISVVCVVWMVAPAAGYDVHVAWSGVDKFALVDAAAGPALAAGSVLTV